MVDPYRWRRSFVPCQRAVAMASVFLSAISLTSPQPTH